MHEFKRIYLVDNSGNTTRVKLSAWGSEQAALDLLKKACPDRRQLVVEYKDRRYMTLTEKVCFVGDFSLSKVLKHLHRFIHATGGWVHGHVWLVKAHYVGEDEAYPIAAFRLHSDAMAAAEAHDSLHDDEDEYTTVELLAYHD